MSSNLEQLQRSTASLGLPSPDQIGFVVRNLEDAMRLYAPLFGPFKLTDYGPSQASYRGRPPSDSTLRFAFGRIGALEIELIEWSDGDTPHGDFIRRGREGVHHLRFRVDDIDHWSKKLIDAGYAAVWGARISPDIAYMYFEQPGDDLYLELLEYPEGGDPTSPMS